MAAVSPVLLLAGGAEAGTTLTYTAASKNYCYGYFNNNKDYCWLMNPQGNWARDTDTYPCHTYKGYNAEDWCESMPEPKPKVVKYDGEASESSSCKPSKLGQAIADFVKGHDGKKVAYSRRRVGRKTTTQCWDLAAAAIDHVNNNGYKVDRWCKDCGNYVWSDTVVPVSQALPGDIVQFVGKYTEGNKWCASGGVHTSVVTECGQNALELVVMEQNPKPVHKNTYEPSKGTSAHAHVTGYTHSGVYVYRLTDKSSDRLFEVHEPIDEDAGYIDDVDEAAVPGAFAACIAAALVLFVVGGLVIAWRRSRVSHCAVRELAADQEGGATEMEIALNKEEGIMD